MMLHREGTFGQHKSPFKRGFEEYITKSSPGRCGKSGKGPMNSNAQFTYYQRITVSKPHREAATLFEMRKMWPWR